MSTHSVAEAKNQLSRLIDLAQSGEAVVITRHGHPVAEIRPIKTNRKAAREADLAWLDSKRVRLRGDGDDAVTVLLKMREEY